MVMKEVINILHIEDLPSDIELIDRALKKSDLKYYKRVVDNRESYEAALGEFAPDLILSDHSLPSFNSIEAFNILKERKLDIPFILITSTVSEEFAVEVMKLGITDYILKDRLHRLPNAIKTALDLKLVKDAQMLSDELERERNLNQIKSNFVSFASHEFRTPLTTISSSVYLLSKYTKTEEQPMRDKHIERIISSVDVLMAILNDFLELGKIEEGKTQPRYAEFNVENTTREIIGDVGLGKKGKQVLQYRHEGAAAITLDAALYQAILTNLLSNAIKYSGEDGRIDISTIVTASRFVLSVKDNGIGIPKDEIKKLTQLFYRTSNASDIQGTGLGLHIISKYIKLMNGKMECFSELGKGAEFKVTFRMQ